MGGGGGEETQKIATQSNLEEESELNLDQVIGNIQVESIELVKLVVPNMKSKQPIVVVVEAS
jgi:hypothetical protein